MPKLTAKTTAEWLIAAHHTAGDPISNLRLQKLLYYAQAWNLAIKDVPLFEEEFEAWIHGPVVPAIYRAYKASGSGTIPPPEVLPSDGEEPKFAVPDLEPADVSHLEDVLKAYGDLSTWQLEQLTHRESPWIEARKGLPSDAPCKNVIPKASMRAFYKSQLNAPGQA